MAESAPARRCGSTRSRRSSVTRTGRRTRRGCRRSRPAPSRRSTSSSTPSGSTARAASSTPGAGRVATRSRSRDAGSHVVGVDLSPDFVGLARARPSRSASPTACASRSATCASLAFDDEFDAVICLCQGGFGLLGGGADEGAVLARFAVRCGPGGRLAVSAFNVVLRACATSKRATLRRGDAASTTSGRTLRDAAGAEREFDLWTTCFTPRELGCSPPRPASRVDRRARRDTRALRRGRRRRSTCRSSCCSRAGTDAGEAVTRPEAFATGRRSVP